MPDEKIRARRVRVRDRSLIVDEKRCSVLCARFVKSPGKIWVRCESARSVHDGAPKITVLEAIITRRIRCCAMVRSRRRARGWEMAGASTGDRSIAACASWGSGVARSIMKRRSCCASRIGSRSGASSARSRFSSTSKTCWDMDRARRRTGCGLVALALEDLPELAEALAMGELSYSAIRELTRVATPMTDHEWRDDARGKNLREIEQRISGRKKGDRPTDPADPDLRLARAAFRGPAGDARLVAAGTAGARRGARDAPRRRRADRRAVQRRARWRRHHR